MKYEHVENGIIESTMLGVQDHGILTSTLHINFGGSGQGFGGYVFDKPVEVDGKHSHREGVAYGMEFIRRILVTVGVERWERLSGKNIRVARTSNFSGGKIIAISHIIKDNWFEPEKDLVHLNWISNGVD